MDKKRTLKTLLLAVLAIAVILGIGAYYITSVRSALWDQTVTDILEVTAQGRHSFDVYMSKNTEMLHNLTINFTKYDSDDVDKIMGKLSERSASEADYVVINLETGVMYANRNQTVRTAGAEELEQYRALEDSGVSKPDISEYTGRSVLSCYERFMFADGTPGLARSELLLSSVASEFSITFYGGEGFSYIADDEGNILVRSNHKNSNRTFDSIFDIIDLDGNDEEALRDFRNAMSARMSGAARFLYRGEEYVFTYVPIENIDGWYFISIIPNSVITEAANSVVKSSQIVIFVVALGIVLAAFIVALIKQNDKKIAEKDQDIRYREQLFGILSENTDDVFLMFTPEVGTVEYVSPNIERVLGIPARAVMDDLFAINSTLCSNDSAIGRDSMKEIKPGSSMSFESERIHGETGEHGWFTEILYCAEVDDTGKLIAVISDRTKERRDQMALEDALSSAKSANDAKSTFLSNMSHDIRTPMNAITGLATLIIRDADDPDKVREHTRKIVSSSRHMLGIINDILDMSKIESGKTTLNIEELDLAELVEELNTVIRPQAKAKDQSFSISVKDIQQETLLGDKLRIEQIMINLLSNAVKYTPEGGRVEMQIRQMPQSTKNYAHMRFTVSDNGMGMSPDYLEHIFSPFTRETNSTTNKIQGTGLGMAITKNLVDLMGGTISVDSKQGRGSTFTVDLELRMQKADIDKSFWAAKGISRALVADDDPDVRTDTAAALMSVGIDVQTAADGETAVEMVLDAHRMKEDYDLVLLDKNTPVLSGVETARRIKDFLPDSMPTVILSTYDKTDVEAEAVSAGIRGFLAKPFFLSNLRQAVDKERGGLTGTMCDFSGDNKRALIVEDNEINAEILLELLSDIPGLICSTAVNGREAFEMFRDSEPGEYDIILMDVQMPIMNGYEATRAIRALNRPDAGTVPIVAMTANAFAEDVKDALDSGMNAHIAKPVDIDRVIEVLREFVEKKSDG